jgi:hypothetical protein
MTETLTETSENRPKPLRLLTKTLAPAVIQANILDQLRASRDILSLVPQLTAIIRQLPDKEENQQVKSELEGVMNRMLNIGKDLSSKATNFGEKIFGDL